MYSVHPLDESFSFHNSKKNILKGEGGGPLGSDHGK